MTPVNRSAALAGLALGLALPAQGEALPENQRAFIDRHCADCHDSETKKGGLDLAALAFDLAKRGQL